MRTLALAVGVCLLAALAAGGVAPPPRRGEGPVAAARARQERVKTLVVRFKQTDVIPRGAWSLRYPWNTKIRGTFPAEEQVITAVNRLVIDGSKVRYEHNHRGWSADGPERGRYVNLRDGTRTVMYFPDGLGSAPPGQAAIYSGEGVITAFFGPLVTAYRWLDPAVTRGQEPASSLQPTGRTVEVRGEACVEYRTAGSKSAAGLYVLSPAKGHLPTRIGDTEITYRRDEGGEWIPAAWVREERSKRGELLFSQRFEVLEVRLNEPVPASLFTLTFPTGTRVHDSRDPGGTDYVVGDDGTLIKVPRGAEPDAPPPSPLARPAVWVLLVAAALAAGAAWLLSRRLTPRPSPPR